MSLREINKIEIPVAKNQKVKSICWKGDELIDIPSGGARYLLDGTVVPRWINHAFRFDRAVLSQSGKYAVIYEVLGTKGLVLKGTKILREINRSFYWAHAYEYPVTIFQGPDGTELLAHCPEAYNKIELEEIESGKRLTLNNEKAPDFFHSRFAASQNGRYFLSAGWVWHPVDCVHVMSVAEALRNSSLASQIIPIEIPEAVFEVHTAAFQDDDFIILNGSAEEATDGPCALARINIGTRKCDLVTPLPETVGTIMPLNQEYLIGFFGCPKLIEISSGKVLHRWPELSTGNQNSSIIWTGGELPPLALDPKNKRFAVAGADRITVIQLG